MLNLHTLSARLDYLYPSVRGLSHAKCINKCVRVFRQLLNACNVLASSVFVSYYDVTMSSENNIKFVLCFVWDLIM